MKDQDKIDEIRKKDGQKLKALKDIADSIAAKKTDEINERTRKAKEKIQALIDRKGEILNEPYSKSFTLEVLKEALRAGRKQRFLDELLVSHVRDVQTHADTPLSDSAMRMHFGDERRLWKMLFALITEKDLEAAVSQLPDIGMSSGEKEAALLKIDEEIEVLQAQIKKELEKL